jgi:hypothetical protein
MYCTAYHIILEWTVWFIFIADEHVLAIRAEIQESSTGESAIANLFL